MLFRSTSDKSSFFIQNKHKRLLFNMIYKYERENGFEFDIIVLTRFDLFFLVPFEKLNINLKKFNFSYSMYKRHVRVDDRFYIFRRSDLKVFNFLLRKNKMFDTHHLYNNGVRKLVRRTEINFMYHTAFFMMVHFSVKDLLSKTYTYEEIEEKCRKDWKEKYNIK